MWGDIGSARRGMPRRRDTGRYREMWGDSFGEIAHGEVGRDAERVGHDAAGRDGLLVEHRRRDAARARA